jgi:hypothetical protein
MQARPGQILPARPRVPGFVHGVAIPRIDLSFTELTRQMSDQDAEPVSRLRSQLHA